MKKVLLSALLAFGATTVVQAQNIDVQTGRITAATEAGGSVNRVDGLTKLAENVVSETAEAPAYAEDAVKLLGPYTTVAALRACFAPRGYHIASKEEVVGIIENHRLTGRKVSFPNICKYSQKRLRPGDIQTILHGILL